MYHQWDFSHFSPVCWREQLTTCEHTAFRNLSARNASCKLVRKMCFCSAGEEKGWPLNGSCQCWMTGGAMLTWVMSCGCERTIIRTWWGSDLQYYYKCIRWKDWIWQLEESHRQQAVQFTKIKFSEDKALFLWMALKFVKSFYSQIGDSLNRKWRSARKEMKCYQTNYIYGQIWCTKWCNMEDMARVLFQTECEDVIDVGIVLQRCYVAHQPARACPVS